MAINLQIFAEDVDTVINTFNVIRVERAPAEVGPFTETTALVAGAARLQGGAGPFNVLGLTLSLAVDNGSQVDVVFTGPASLTTDQVVSQINLALGSAIASNSSNDLILTSLTTGTSSKIEIIGGAAAPVLGFTAGQEDFGEDPYIPLVSGQTSYSYTDEAGESGTWYRTRYFNTLTNVFSAYSDAFRGDLGLQVPASALSTCSVSLVDMEGNAKVGQQIAFYPVSTPIQVSGFWVGATPTPIVIETDSGGQAEVDLVIGQKLRAVFVGTTLVREFVVPDSDFDLLTVLSTSPDIFDVQQPQIPAAPRRTT